MRLNRRRARLAYRLRIMMEALADATEAAEAAFQVETDCRRLTLLLMQQVQRLREVKCNGNSTEVHLRDCTNRLRRLWRKRRQAQARSRRLRYDLLFRMREVRSLESPQAYVRTEEEDV